MCLQIGETDIFAVIKNLDSKVSYRCDNLSIRMIKLCGKSIIYTLKLIFEALLQKGKFPSSWKKTNVVSLHQKEDKILDKIKNYRFASLLPIFLINILENTKDLFNYFH